MKYRVGFSLIPGVGRVRLALIEAFFRDLEKAWNASPGELKSAGLDAKLIETILTMRGQISLDIELEKLKRYKVKVLTGNDACYPARLKEIYDSPPLLYVKGTILPEDELAIAVVGTRRSSVYGKQVTEEIVADLVRNKITIVSGLARGIDSIAHRTALEAGGRTIAVTGCGLDMVYPADHVALAQKVMENGAMISEFPIGTKPKPEHFPQRNRIISGMSLGVLVIEAGEKSGALLTAHLALEQNRDIFAVPGSIFSPASKGTNRIIQEGAKLVRNCAAILEELNLSCLPQQMGIKEFVPATDIESRLLTRLSKEAIHIDDLCRHSGLPIASVSSTLAMLELKGIVKQLGGMNYILA